MKRILESGQFSNYRDGIRLDSASREVSSIYQSYGMTTVFISHKHEDLEDLSGLIGFLEKNYNVKAYIDSKRFFYAKCDFWCDGIKNKRAHSSMR